MEQSATNRMQRAAPEERNATKMAGSCKKSILGSHIRPAPVRNGEFENLKLLKRNKICDLFNKCNKKKFL